MGGMAAQIPIKNHPEKNDLAMSKVQSDKLREANAGHDGTWIAHPGLSSIAMDAFNSVMADEQNQIDVITIAFKHGSDCMLESGIGAQN